MAQPDLPLLWQIALQNAIDGRSLHVCQDCLEMQQDEICQCCVIAQQIMRGELPEDDDCPGRLGRIRRRPPGRERIRWTTLMLRSAASFIAMMVLVSRLPVESGQRDLDKRRPSDIPSARDRMRRQPMVGPQGVINRQHAYSRSRLEEYEALQRGMG